MLHRLPRFRTLLAASLCLAVGAVDAQQGGDLQARILYAFHAEDTNQLTSLVQTLATQVQAEGADRDLRYHLAHAEYRLGLLQADTRARDADAAFAECIAQLKAILQRDAESVETLILQSACYANAARRGGVGAVLERSRAADRLAAAAKRAPRNPRVVYLQAIDALARSPRGSAEYEEGYARLQLAAQLFGDVSATGIDEPGWGHAEAYLELGRQLELRGDILGARNWIEKALLAAPDYKAAQRELADLIRR